MKNIMKFLFAALVITLFAGCTVPVADRKHVNEDWTVTPPGLTVYILDTKVQNGNDFNKALPDHVGKFNEWFLPRLTQDIVNISGLETNVYPDVSRSGNFKKVKRSVKRYMDFMVSYPDAAKLPELKGIVATISGLTLNRHVTMKRHNGSKVYMYGVQAYASYSIYSMELKKIVSYGKIDVLEESEDFVPSEEVWSKVVRGIANDVLSETPLIRKK